MNAKKRNKNKSGKPPTPNTPQKDDTPVDTEIKDKNVEEKAEIVIKSEERVPEIISEIITPVEAKVSEDDTPKKPKRNRGKKKKGDKGDEALRDISAEPSIEPGSKINVDECTDETTAKTSEISVTPAARKKKNKNKKLTEQQPEKKDEQSFNIVPISKEEFMPDLKIINLVPVATDGIEECKSKKKNKKKKRLDSEKSDKAEEVLSCTAAFQKLLEPKDDKNETKKDEIVDVKLSISHDTVPIQEQQEKAIKIFEAKQGLCDDTLDKPNETFKEERKSKKKNKKDKKFPPKHETEVTDQSKCEAYIENLEVIEKVDNLEKKPEASALKECTFEKKEMKPEIRDEKHIDIHETKMQIDTQMQQIKTSKISETKPIEEVKSAIQPPLLQMEKSPKPKAKIAKPVDKKLKGMTDNQYVQDISHSIEVMPKKDEEVVPKTVDTVTESNIEITEFKNITEPLPELPKEEVKIEMKIEKQESKIDIKQPTEQMQVPQDKRNKRKKSPKPSKVTHSFLDLKSELDDIIPKEDLVKESEEKVIKTEETVLETKLEINQPPITIALIETPSTQCLPQIQSILMTNKESKEDIKQEKEQKPVENILGNILASVSPPRKDKEEKVEDIKVTEIPEQKQELIKKEPTPVPLSFVEELPSQSKPAEFIDNSNVPMEMKETQVHTEVTKFEKLPLPQSGGGKKRKKSPKPKKIDLSTEKPESKEEQKTAEEDSRDNVQESNESLDLPPLEDIGNRSVKLEESDGTICEIVPEVHHPRATSLDNNNNMVIREVTSVDEDKLNIPIVLPDTPFIEGSGESPLPEITSSGITITEVATTLNLEEKTDLKSKVMEVNTDMEELRRSIERSLAELTAMEKSEEQTEKKFEQAQAKIEAIKNLALKQETSISKVEIVAKEDDPNLIPKSETEVTQVIQQQSNVSKFEEQKPITPLDQSKTEQIQADVINTTGTKIESVPVPIKEETVQEKQQKVVENVPVNVHTSPPPPRKDNKEETVQDKQQNLGENVPVYIPTPPPPPRKDNKEETVQDKQQTLVENVPVSIPTPPSSTSKDNKEETVQDKQQKVVDNVPVNVSTPPPPPRKDNKGKNKKKKGKQEVEHVASTQSTTESGTSTTSTKESKTEDTKKEEKSEQKSDSKEEKGKQQLTSAFEDNNTAQAQDSELANLISKEFEPIENFEDALTSNDTTEDVNKTFEMIANEVSSSAIQNKPDINIEAPTEDDEKKDGNEQINPVSQPKNLLGHPVIPARLNRTDYKKEKNKAPNTKQAKVKIKDSVPIEVNKQSKESQTENNRRFLKDKTVIETVSSVINDDEEYIYKYSFRRVFLPSACHTCKKDLKFGRSPCNFCNLIFYCGPKHRDEDYPQHQALCFAVSTIAHLKGKCLI